MTAIGLAIPVESADDHFVVALVSALAEPVVQSGRSLVTQVVHDQAAEEAVYRHWAHVGGVDGVALLGVGAGDVRPGLLTSLGFVHVAVVDASVPVDFAGVVVDANASVTVLRRFLATRPHRRTIYLTGPAESDTTASRVAAMRAIDDDDLIDVVRSEHPVDAALAAAAIALDDEKPITLVFDSDVHAAAALDAFLLRAIEVPERVALVSWTNSVLCQSTTPVITAIDRRGSEIGALLGARMIGALAGDVSSRDSAPDPIVVVGDTA